jgi:hypothetical protein
MTRLSMKPVVLAALLGFAAVASGPAQAQSRIKTGTLVCDVSAGFGMIIASRKAVSCTFTNTRGAREDYVGTFTTVGIDVGVTTAETVVWAVFQPSAAPWSLAGTYVGATAEATVVAGLGANVLVGGSNKTIALQPVSVSGQTGLNIAAGIGGMTLNRVQ